MHRQQSGFTIIELVVVIILLGILAATALPRFMNVDDEAHAAVVAGVMGGLQTGVSLYHAQWIAEGQPNANTQIADFNLLRTNAAGFPYGTADNSGTGSNVTNSADCAAVFTGVLQAGAPSVSSVAALANVVGSVTDFTAVRTGVNCDYYYTGQRSTSGATIPLLQYGSVAGVVTQTTAALP
ncbi:MAG: prepilin-type N-terminal cleavage/methylation domain-containing protein [Gammaproteobacteria bacterium]|nr:prepilin-type N-terminal cleavage/methylation domain-containing protein [Gammaproteobacteria bacterium]